MKVRVKFYCDCEAYVDQIIDPDIEPVESSDKPVIQISLRYAGCEYCGKAHEIGIYHFKENKLLVLAENDVEEFEYERC